MQINRTQKPTLPQIVTVCKDLQTKQPKPSIDFPQNMRPNGVKFLFRILKQNQQGNWEKWDGITPSNISETYTGNCSDSHLCIWIAQVMNVSSIHGKIHSRCPRQYIYYCRRCPSPIYSAEQFT